MTKGIARPHPERPAPPAGSPPKRVAAVREVEVKLAATPAALAKLAALPQLAKISEGGARTRHQVTTYHDTPDLALAAQGMALRVRVQGGRRIQAMKTWRSDAGTAAAAGRREWEWELAPEGDGPDLTLLPPTLAGLLPAAAWTTVAPRFTTDIERTALLLHPDTRTTIELALDRGQVRLAGDTGDGDTVWPVAEVELELKDGRVAALFEVAALLHHHVPLRLTTGSKADAGLRLLTGKPATAVPAQPVTLTPVTTVAEGFRHAARQALSHLLDNATVLLEAGATPEGPLALRQMAAASRRLDTALRLLRLAMTLPATTLPPADKPTPVAQAPNPHVQAADALRRRLAPLRAALEAARGWDRLAERIALLPDRKGAAGLSRRQHLGLANAAARAHRDVAKRLRGAGHTAFILDLAAWIEGGGWTSPALDLPFKTIAPRLMAELQDKVAKAVARLDLPDPIQAGIKSPGVKPMAPAPKAPPPTDALERLRRRIQRLHEAAEACRGLYQPRTAPSKAKTAKRPPADALAPLTRLHAAALAPLSARQATRLVTTLAKGSGPKPRSTRLLSRLAQEEALALTKLPATWRGYARRRMFWMVGR
ncbi:MAG: CYTH domain-containing protein [Azospirillaceae bacterium]|nr:CYTH domain-containing protein [Azospirillaceae bacterium]